MQTNNKLREALGKLRAELWNNTVIAGKRKIELYEIADAALAEPVKNCEVGTVEEMEKRMDAYCARNSEERIDGSWHCDNCPLCSINRCALAWAQMPYDEEGGAK